MDDIILQTQKEFVEKLAAELKKAFEKTFGEPFDTDVIDKASLKRFVYAGDAYYCYKDECFFILTLDMQMKQNKDNYTLVGLGRIPNKTLYIREVDGRINFEFKKYTEKA